MQIELILALVSDCVLLCLLIGVVYCCCIMSGDMSSAEKESESGATSSQETDAQEMLVEPKFVSFPARVIDAIDFLEVRFPLAFSVILDLSDSIHYQSRARTGQSAWRALGLMCCSGDDVTACNAEPGPQFQLTVMLVFPLTQDKRWMRFDVKGLNAYYTAWSYFVAASALGSSLANAMEVGGFVRSVSEPVHPVTPIRRSSRPARNSEIVLVSDAELEEEDLQSTLRLFPAIPRRSVRNEARMKIDVALRRKGREVSKALRSRSRSPFIDRVAVESGKSDDEDEEEDANIVHGDSEYEKDSFCVSEGDDDDNVINTTTKKKPKCYCRGGDENWGDLCWECVDMTQWILPFRPVLLDERKLILSKIDIYYYSYYLFDGFYSVNLIKVGLSPYDISHITLVSYFYLQTRLSLIAGAYKLKHQLFTQIEHWFKNETEMLYLIGKPGKKMIPLLGLDFDWGLTRQAIWHMMGKVQTCTVTTEELETSQIYDCLDKLYSNTLIEHSVSTAVPLHASQLKKPWSESEVRAAAEAPEEGKEKDGAE